MATSDDFTQGTPAPVATKVGAVEIILTVTAGEGGNPNIYSGRYSFDRLTASGVIADVRQGNLLPHLTAQQVTTAKAFLDAMLAKAQGTI
jgi:hypothetical protein